MIDSATGALIPDPITPVQNTAGAVLAGVEQAMAASAPAVVGAAVGVAAATNPNLAIALAAAQALEPSVAQLVQMASAGLMTQPQLDAAVANMKANLAAIHSSWLASVTPKV